jgi:sporulation protein YlmC with PRC-barrel domain
LQRSSKIVGSKVENAQGQNLGDIEDIVIDTETGRIAYAVISFGGFLGVGDKLFAVPMGALKRNPNKADMFVLNIDKERLKNAPGFDKDKWPRLDDRQWMTTVYTFYGQPFYWETSGAVLNATVADTKGTLKLKTADGRITELVVPEAMMLWLTSGG